MKKLLSLPPNLVRKGEKGGTIFHQITELSEEEYFCTCDPEGHRIGSGGGSAWLLMEAFRQSRKAQFDEWLSSEKRILLHAGGQSRRLPSYAPSGKILTPIPVFRWERGQRLSQDLMSLQLPLYEQMMNMAPKGLNTMIVSGDVLIRTNQPLGPVPQADVVVYGLWLDASVAKNHGVFVSDRRTPQVLKQMLQKPSVEELHQLQKNHYYLTDIGVWILSDRAIRLLMNRCMEGDASANSQIKYYDLYSDFGRSLGTEPLIDDADIKSLSVAVVPLAGGEFYHFGTSREMISSTVILQNLVSDQRQIMHHDLKPHPSIFVQNALLDVSFSAENQNIWIENSHIGKRWKLTSENIVTGVPRNDWQITLAPGQCLDIVPVGDDRFAVEFFRGSKCRHHLVQCLNCDLLVVFLCSVTQHCQRVDKAVGVYLYLAADKYELVGGLFQPLLVHKQLFLYLFARTKPRKDYLYVLVRLLAVHSYKVFGKRHDPDRLTHIKHEYLAALCKGCCLKHKAHSLGYGHKVSDDIGVCYRNGFSVLYLLFEKRYYRAV